MTLGGSYYFYTHFWEANSILFVMSDQDSSKMRVSERNETCFNCRTEAVSHLQNAKTQNYKNTKMQNYKNAKGAKSFFQIDKENAYILQRKRRWQTENRAVHCAQMCRKYTPKGEMGYPKWRNGIPQMAKWDTPNGQMGHPKWGNGIPQMVKWDIPNGEMGHNKRRFGTLGVCITR